MKKIITLAVVTFCMAMMPVVCFADDETSGTSVEITNIANVQTAAPGDEVTFTINTSVNGVSDGLILIPYIIENPSEYLENIRIQSVTGTQGVNQTPLNIGYSTETESNGKMTIHFWDSEEFDDNGQKMLFVGSQVTIVIQAKITENAPAGKLYNTVTQFGTYSTVALPDEKANAVAFITVQVDTPEPTNPTVGESIEYVRDVRDNSPETGDESFAGFIWSILLRIF